jgi:hypothetical protein
MATALPYDLAASQEDIDYKRQLAQALMQASMSPQQGQMVSGHYIAPGLGGALLQLTQGMRGRQLRQEARQGAADLGQTYQGRLSSGIEKYLGNNTPGQTLTDDQAGQLLDNDMDPGKLAEPSRNPRAAAAQAIGSGIPELQKLGFEDIQAMAQAMRKSNEPEEFGTDPRLMTGPDGQLQNVLVGKRGTIKPVVGYTPATKMEATAGGQLYDPYGGKAGPYLGEKYTEPRPVNGEMVSFGEKSNKPVQAATRPPQTRVEVVNAAQKAGLSEWSNLAAKTVSGMADEARGSVKLLGQLNQMERSGQLGVFSGSTANAAMFFSNLAQSLGVPVEGQRLANSETFVPTAITAWQDMVRQAGGNRGITAPESEKIMQSVPQLSQSPQGRQQLIAYLRQLAHQNIADAHLAQQEYSEALTAQDPKKFTFGLGAAQIPRADALPAVPGAGKRAPSQALPLTDTRGWRLHRDANGNAAYVSPDGKQFEEVK